MGLWAAPTLTPSSPLCRHACQQSLGSGQCSVSLISLTFQRRAIARDTRPYWRTISSRLLTHFEPKVPTSQTIFIKWSSCKSLLCLKSTHRRVSLAKARCEDLKHMSTGQQKEDLGRLLHTRKHLWSKNSALCKSFILGALVDYLDMLDYLEQHKIREDSWCCT